MSTNFFRKRKKTVVLAIAIFAGVALIGSTLLGAGLGGLGGGGFNIGGSGADYQAELDAYKAEAEQNPDDIVSWLNLGGVQLYIGGEYLQENREARATEFFEDAFESFDKALELDNESIEALANKSVASIYLNDVETARENIEKAYEIAPDDPDVINLYGVFYLQTGEIEKAVSKWEEILEIEDLDEADRVQYENMIDQYKELLEGIELEDKEDKEDIEDIDKN